MTEKLTKYRIKAGCEIAHADRDYRSGDEVELTPDLALFHAANLEMPAAPPNAKTPPPKTDD